ncbi:AarF/UbiB family protein [Nocardia sp. NPDC056100]|uniref:AarF/UbiB family protein n=1 Tax=Nocardia sp. NPDC056100 TaxID=3345712 RepID=UPI0035E0A210
MATANSQEFPTAGSYQEALQHPKICFTDTDLRDSVPELTKLRQPRAISGAFASVFPLTHSRTGTRYAIKCFTRHVPDQQARYQAISKKLSTVPQSNLSQPWKIGFEYLPDAILVGKDRYPILKMEWVQGVTLSAWLDTHHCDSSSVDRLAELFAGLISDLAKHGIAHGDLQHGNLMVTDDGTLRLLDYDGMFVPALSGLGGTERGHRNYQSPIRGNGDFGAELDRFSAWVIYLALKSVARDPELWRQLHEQHGEYLLLTESDFTNPVISQRFPALLSHVDSEIRDLAERVRLLASQPLTGIPALSTATGGAASSSAPPTGTMSRGLPSWMAGYVTPSEPMQLKSTRLGDTLPRFAKRRAVDVLATILFLVTAVAALPSFIFFSPAIAFGPIAGAWVAIWAARRSRPEVTALESHLLELHERRAGIADVAAAEAAIRVDQGQHDLSEQQRLTGLPRQRSHLKVQHDRQLEEIDRQRRTRRSNNDRRRVQLKEKLQKSKSDAYANERAEYVRKDLMRFKISSSSITGIGSALTRELAAHGIRTAADFDGIQLSSPSGNYNSATAYLLTSGGPIYVKGIGEAKARALDNWRNAHASKAISRFSRNAPTSTSTGDSKYNLEMSKLAQADQQAENEASQKRIQAEQTYIAAIASLSTTSAAAAAAAEKKRHEFTRRLSALQNSPAVLAGIDRQIDDTQNHRKALSHTRFMRFALVGR